MERTITLTVEVEDDSPVIEHILRDLDIQLHFDKRVKDYKLFTPRLPKYFKEGYK